MSSLRLRIKVKETKSAIVVNECTGKYSGDNKGGWGNPNPELSGVAKAQFEIWMPKATAAVIISVFPEFPTDDTEFGYQVLTSQLGINKVTSGTWKVGYRVSGLDRAGLPYEKYAETKVVFFKDAECCVDKLMAKTANVPVNVFMKDEKKKSAAELSVLLENAKWLGECGDFVAAQNVLEYINLQCGCCS